MHADGVGVTPTPLGGSPLIDCLRRHPSGQGVPLLEGWSMGCVGFLPLSADIAAIGKLVKHVRLLPTKEKKKALKRSLHECI